MFFSWDDQRDEWCISAPASAELQLRLCATRCSAGGAQRARSFNSKIGFDSWASDPQQQANRGWKAPRITPPLPPFILHRKADPMIIWSSKEGLAILRRRITLDLKTQGQCCRLFSKEVANLSYSGPPSRVPPQQWSPWRETGNMPL